MSLTRRDRLFICSVGATVVVACAVITLTRPAEARQTSLANATYTIVQATGSKATAYCPSGSHLLGGGGHDNANHTFRAINVRSYPVIRPHGQPAGWEFGVESDSYRWIDTKAFAICARL
jgi:hypothetical protein